jgi:branched-chain amino acid transport system substrate-binding protein
MTPDVTGIDCNSYTFRISQNGPQNLRGAALLASKLKPKKWTTIGPDYIFGHQCWEYFQKYLREKRPDVSFAPKSETVFAPVKTNKWKPIVERAMQLDADGVLISLYGGNLRDFIKQASEMGFFDGKREILMNLALSSEVFYSLKGLMPKGLWLSGLYWHKINDNPQNQKFVKAYMNRHKVFPDQSAHGAYAGIKAYAAAVKKAASTNKDEIVRALEGLMVQIPAGTVTIRPEDHQAICDGIWGKTNGYDVKTGCRLLNPVRVFPGMEIIRSVSETTCKRSRQVAESQ